MKWIYDEPTYMAPKRFMCEKLEAVKFLNLTFCALSDTLLLFWHWPLVTTPSTQNVKIYVEPKFAFMSMFCFHILTVRKSELIWWHASSPRLMIGFHCLVHLLQKGRSHRVLLKYSDKVNRTLCIAWYDRMNWQAWSNTSFRKSGKGGRENSLAIDIAIDKNDCMLGFDALSLEQAHKAR